MAVAVAVAPVSTWIGVVTDSRAAAVASAAEQVRSPVGSVTTRRFRSLPAVGADREVMSSSALE
jgi:hypothetical protein